MKPLNKELREEICPGHIIQGNPILKAVVNISHHDPNIFFEHKDIVNYCTNHCTQIVKCKEIYKKHIANIFTRYDKEVIKYIPKPISIG